jgi:hypothetical protein
MTPIKCISLHDPWASAIALGLKPVETRSWSTKYRGTLGIHAAKKWTHEQRWFNADLCVRFPKYSKLMATRLFPLGHVIALVDLYDCKPTDKYCGTDPLTLALGDFTPGRYAWLLKNIRRLPHPVPAIGRQGFFTVPIDMIQPDGGVF